MTHFKVLSVDAWGNENDGWTANDLFHTGNIIDIKEIDGPQDVANKLKKIYRLEAVTVEMHETDIFVNDANTDEPLFHLKQVNK